MPSLKSARSYSFGKPGDGLNVALNEFVAKRIGPRGWNSLRTASLGCFSGQEIVGATVFHDWNPEAGTMAMSGAGEPGWMTLKHLFLAHWYIFEASNCQLAILQVSERNDRMRRTAEHFGYTGHVIPRLRGRNEAEVVYTLPVEDWLASKFTQRVLRRGSPADVL